MELKIITDNFRNRVKEISSDSPGKNIKREICRFKNLKGELLGSKEFVEEKLPDCGKRAVTLSYDEFGRLTRKLDVAWDRFGNKNIKIIVNSDRTLDVEYSRIALFKGKKKPLQKTYYNSDGRPRQMVVYNYSKSGREESTEYYDYNKDGTIQYEKSCKEGSIEILFSADGVVLSEKMLRRYFNKSVVVNNPESYMKIFNKSLEAQSLKEYLKLD